MGRSYSVQHAADLCRMLPLESRVFCALSSGGTLSKEEHLLSAIYYMVQVVVKAVTGSKSFKPEYAKFSDPYKEKDSLDLDELKVFLAQERKEV